MAIFDFFFSKFDTSTMITSGAQAVYDRASDKDLERKAELDKFKLEEIKGAWRRHFAWDYMKLYEPIGYNAERDKPLDPKESKKILFI